MIPKSSRASNVLPTARAKHHACRSDAAAGRSSLLPLPSRHRVFILTDITNEPDDAESFCRYLTYANQLRTEGVVAVTSTWLRDRVAPQNLHQIVDAYEKVVENLNAHVHPDFPYPSADEVRGLIRSGPPVYGMETVGDDVPLSEGGELLLQRLTAPPAADGPLWVLVWGGVNVLAQVLHRIRVYTISDQDGCGAWIRQQWPEVFYIASVHGWNQYGCAAWTGISGDAPGEQGGPDGSKITAEWVRENIQFIIEGDTPTFLYLIRNGLGVPEEPSYGSWGGRYLPVNMGGSRSALTARWGHRADATDTVVGADGRGYRSSKATVWRWRNAFQDDFAARMRWTLTPDFAACNHHPVISIDGDVGCEPVRLEADAGGTVAFDASGTYDPDGDELAFRWFQYREPSATQTFHPYEISDLTVEPEGGDGSRVRVTIAPADKSCMRVRDKIPIERGLLLHLILEVTDKGTPPLTSYVREDHDPAGESQLQGPRLIGDPEARLSTA